MKLTKISTLLLSILFVIGCATTGNSPVVKGGDNISYGDANAVETVTLDFGSTDLQSIAESMTRSLLQSDVIAKSKDRPLVRVDSIKNKTSEYIDTASITDSIRTQLTKSGSVRFAGNEQSAIDELNKQNQSGLYKKKKSNKIGTMEAPDYVLEGAISSIVKKSGSVKDVYYKFTLNLSDVGSNVIEWSDEKEIRKTKK